MSDKLPVLKQTQTNAKFCRRQMLTDTTYQKISKKSSIQNRKNNTFNNTFCKIISSKAEIRTNRQNFLKVYTNGFHNYTWAKRPS
jgi:hypothetical protein